jgi:hypothetical protein
MIAIHFKGNGFSGWAPRAAETAQHAAGAALNPRYLLGRLTWFIILGGIVIEALLAVRLWAQLTSQAATEQPLSYVFSATDFLIGPFRSAETAQPIRETGVLEFSTLVAMEAYLAAAVGGMLLLFIAPRLVRLAMSFVLPAPEPATATSEPRRRPSRAA